MRTALLLVASLAIPALGGTASADRWGFHTPPARDMSRPERPVVVREARPSSGLSPMARAAERSRPGEGTGSASRDPTAQLRQVADPARREGTLEKQHMHMAQGAVDKVVRKVTHENASTSDSNGGSSSRDALKTAAQIKALANNPDAGLLGRKALERVQGMMGAAIGKKSGGHASMRDSDGGNDTRLSKQAAAKLRGVAHEAGQGGILARQQLAKAQGALDKVMLQKSHQNASTRSSNGGSSSREANEGAAKIRGLGKPAAHVTVDRLERQVMRKRIERE